MKNTSIGNLGFTLAPPPPPTQPNPNKKSLGPAQVEGKGTYSIDEIPKSETKASVQSQRLTLPSTGNYKGTTGSQYRRATGQQSSYDVVQCLIFLSIPLPRLVPQTGVTDARGGRSFWTWGPGGAPAWGGGGLGRRRRRERLSRLACK